MEGSCHCGAVRWRLAGVPETATACNCSLCRRYGALWAYGHENEDITVSGPTRFYIWNKRWIEFHFCPTCASITHWRGAGAGPDGRRRAAVNLRLAPPEAVSAIALVHHDGETMSDLPPDGKHISDVWS
jgi:hypothetical protein